MSEMTFDALLKAAEFLEQSQATTRGTTRGGESVTSDVLLCEIPTVVEDRTRTEVPSTENHSALMAERSDTSDVRQIHVFDTSLPRMPIPRTPGPVAKEAHNKLEKKRRAHMRECFTNLRRAIQLDSREVELLRGVGIVRGGEDDHSGSLMKVSNLLLLRAAIKHIQELQNKEAELAVSKDSLQRELMSWTQRLIDHYSVSSPTNHGRPVPSSSLLSFTALDEHKVGHEMCTDDRYCSSATASPVTDTADESSADGEIDMATEITTTSIVTTCAAGTVSVDAFKCVNATIENTSPSITTRISATSTIPPTMLLTTPSGEPVRLSLAAIRDTSGANNATCVIADGGIQVPVWLAPLLGAGASRVDASPRSSSSLFCAPVVTPIFNSKPMTIDMPPNRFTLSSDSGIQLSSSNGLDCVTDTRPMKVDGNTDASSHSIQSVAQLTDFVTISFAGTNNSALTDTLICSVSPSSSSTSKTAKTRRRIKKILSPNELRNNPSVGTVVAIRPAVSNSSSAIGGCNAESTTNVNEQQLLHFVKPPSSKSSISSRTVVQILQQTIAQRQQQQQQLQPVRSEKVTSKRAKQIPSTKRSESLPIPSSPAFHPIAPAVMSLPTRSVLNNSAAPIITSLLTRFPLPITPGPLPVHVGQHPIAMPHPQGTVVLQPAGVSRPVSSTAAPHFIVTASMAQTLLALRGNTIQGTETTGAVSTKQPLILSFGGQNGVTDSECGSKAIILQSTNNNIASFLPHNGSTNRIQFSMPPSMPSAMSINESVSFRGPFININHSESSQVNSVSVISNSAPVSPAQLTSTAHIVTFYPVTNFNPRQCSGLSSERIFQAPPTATISTWPTLQVASSPSATVTTFATQQPKPR